MTFKISDKLHIHVVFLKLVLRCQPGVVSSVVAEKEIMSQWHHRPKGQISATEQDFYPECEQRMFRLHREEGGRGF